MWGDGNVLELRGGDGCSIVNVLNNPGVAQFKMVQMVNSVLCLFCHYKICVYVYTHTRTHTHLKPFTFKIEAEIPGFFLFGR